MLFCTYVIEISTLRRLWLFLKCFVSEIIITILWEQHWSVNCKRGKIWVLSQTYPSRAEPPAHWGAGTGTCWGSPEIHTASAAQCSGCRTSRPGAGISPAPWTGGWTAHSDSDISPPAPEPWPEGDGQTRDGGRRREGWREERQTGTRTWRNRNMEENDKEGESGSCEHLHTDKLTHTHTHFLTHTHTLCVEQLQTWRVHCLLTHIHTLYLDQSLQRKELLGMTSESVTDSSVHRPHALGLQLQIPLQL